MKKIALTVAVLGLGLAACQDNAPDNAVSTENTIETEAASDVNSVGNDLTATADNALDAAGNGVDAAGNVADDAANGADNAL
jgi:hypothetical protein